MKVSVKDFSVSMDLGYNGIELEVRDPAGKRHLGDLRIAKSTIEWCAGKTRKGNGNRFNWTDLIAWMEKQ